tara:strand:+ start:45 stop:266 length:222 start_codon:yes stop_codon:yes gene_type:complete
MKKDIIKQNEETTDYIVAMVLNYYDCEETGERHYDLECIREELENHIIGIIDTHNRKGIKINKAYLDMLERVK